MDEVDTDVEQGNASVGLTAVLTACIERGPWLTWRPSSVQVKVIEFRQAWSCGDVGVHMGGGVVGLDEFAYQCLRLAREELFGGAWLVPKK